jgi:hypothetical protein
LVPCVYTATTTASVAALASSKEQEASQQGLLEKAREENDELYEKATSADQAIAQHRNFRMCIKRRNFGEKMVRARARVLRVWLLNLTFQRIPVPVIPVTFSILAFPF